MAIPSPTSGPRLPPKSSVKSHVRNKCWNHNTSNIGIPANPMLPYYAEQQPDAQGYAANPAGSGYVGPGVGGFLAERNLLSHPSAVDARWHPLTAENMGRFQMPTLRNVDKRPNPDFVKAYGHNGYF